jgi:hypothetical protein
MTWKNGLWPQRHREQDVKGPSLGRRRVVAKDDLIVIPRDIERRPFRIDLDHRAVRVAACRHEGTLQWPKWIALAAHQLGEHLGNVLRLTGRYRYVVDHWHSPSATSHTT